MASPTPPTQQDISRACEEALRTALDPAGTGGTNLQPGSDNAVLVSVVTQGTGKVVEYVSGRVAARDIDNAADSDLDDIARDIYKDGRKEPAKAVGTIYLQRSNTAATSIPIGRQFGVQATDTQAGVQFAATATLAVALNQLKVAVPVECTRAGEIGNVALADVDQILDALPDSTWSVYVPSPGDPVLAGGAVDIIGGGADRESDPILKARLKQISTDAEPGTPPGVLKGALQVPGVQYVDVVEPFDGTMVVYAGDAGSQLPSALRARIATALEAWRAFGSPLILRAYNVVTVPVAVDMYMATPLKNYDQGQLVTDAKSRVKIYFGTRPRSDEYYLNAIEGAIFKSNEDVQQAVLSSPATSQQRPSDSSYGAITALNRYVVDDTSIFIALHDPLTS
jgi:uncharacterized phage protein gp47/JayE